VSFLCMQVWFYEHTSRFSAQDRKRYPRIASWGRVDHGGRYDATELVEDIKEEEVSIFLMSITVRYCW